ncbi:MAG: hypothetical protein KJ587_20150 [Alphaproteobacteria bacterium]|nr:hypothetical protein [Alphaproteobacteria bacterium]
MANSFRSNIREALFDMESTQGTERTLVADLGSSTVQLLSGEFVETLNDEIKGFLAQCLTGHADNVAAGYKKITSYYYESVGEIGTAYFDADAWPQAITAADTFRVHLLPRTDTLEMTPTDEFAEMTDFQRDSLEKYPDDFMRTVFDGNVAGKLGGMGAPAAYDIAVSGSGTTLVVANIARFKVGSVIHVNNPVTDRVEVTAISGSTCTLKNALAAPLAGGEILRVYTGPGEWGWLMAAAIGEAFQSGHAGLVNNIAGGAAANPTASAWEIQDSFIDQFDEEGIIEVDVSGTFEVTQISDITGDIMTVDPPLSSAPAVNALVRPGWSMRQNLDGHDSFGMSGYMHKILRRIHGISIGDMAIEGVEGADLPKITFPMVGIGDEDTPTDVTIPTAFSSRKFTNRAPKKASAKFLIAPTTAGAATYECRSWGFNMGNDASRRDAITGTDGVAGTDVMNQDPVMTASLNTLTIAAWNPRTALQADTLQRVVAILGTEPGRRVVMWFNQAQLKLANPGQENENRDYYELEIRPKRAGDATKHGVVVALL